MTEIRACCPECGSSNMVNYGDIIIEAKSWDAQIWIVNGKIEYRCKEVNTDEWFWNGEKKFGLKENHELFNPSYYRPSEDMWECKDCSHNFHATEAKAAIKGPPLAELLDTVL